MIRAVRFSAQLHFHIESETFAAIQKLGPLISQVSRERIKDELSKLLQTSSISIGFKALVDSGLLFQLHPQLSEFLSPFELEKLLNIFACDLKQIHLLSKFCILFAARVSQNSTQEYQQLRGLLKDLKFSGADLEKILWVLKASSKLSDFDQLSLAEQIQLVANEHFSILSEFERLYHPAVFAAREAVFKTLSAEYLIDGLLPDVLVDGEDLKTLGLKPGKVMGQILELIRNEQLEKKLKTKQQALSRARQLVADSLNGSALN